MYSALKGALAITALILVMAPAASAANTDVGRHLQQLAKKIDSGVDELTEPRGYEKDYLRTYRDFAEQFGVQAAGRNLVKWGQPTKRGAREATKGEVLDSTAYMDAALNPPEPVYAEAPTGTYSSSGVASSSATAQCESGGDYGAVNPAGYYGAYQFDQQTWDAYAPAGYAGVNPATAPPAVQDAAAAAVDYDAWPNCP